MLLLDLYIYAVEGDTHTEASKRLMMRGSLQHHEFLEEMGTETIAAVIHILVIEIVVGSFAQHCRTVGSTLSLGDIARRVANLEM